MKALFGEGIHPDADRIQAEMTAAGAAAKAIAAAVKLGREFTVADAASGFPRRLAVAYAAHNTANSRPARAKLDAEVRARIRTRVARDMFAETYRRPPGGERELSGWTACNARPDAESVAGFDFTFSPVKTVSTLWAVTAIALLEQEPNGPFLNTGQAQLVEAFATSGSRVQLALAPADAGLASTRNLDSAVTWVTASGARDIASARGVLTLTDVVRFADPAEGPPSLALRGRDPAALGFYLDRGRVHVHVRDPTTTLGAAYAAYAAWAANRERGVDSVMMASTTPLPPNSGRRSRP